MLSYKKVSEVPESEQSAFVYKKGRRRIIINVDRSKGVVVARLPIGVSVNDGCVFGIPSVADEVVKLNRMPFDCLNNSQKSRFRNLKNIKGIAKCSPEDVFSLDTGIENACKRLETKLFGEIKSVISSEVNKLMSRYASIMNVPDSNESDKKCKCCLA